MLKIIEFKEVSGKDLNRLSWLRPLYKITTNKGIYVKEKAHININLIPPGTIITSYTSTASGFKWLNIK